VNMVATWLPLGASVGSSTEGRHISIIGLVQGEDYWTSDNSISSHTLKTSDLLDPPHKPCE